MDSVLDRAVGIAKDGLERVTVVEKLPGVNETLCGDGW